MKNVQKIIDALRCSADYEHHHRKDCMNCPYRTLDEVDVELPVKPDVEIDGVEYWESCDCDQICIDAAELLEKIADIAEGYDGNDFQMASGFSKIQKFLKE